MDREGLSVAGDVGRELDVEVASRCEGNGSVLMGGTNGREEDHVCFGIEEGIRKFVGTLLALHGKTY